MAILFISLALILASIAVVSFPLIFQSLESHTLADGIDTEYRERDALLEALNELEISYYTGKLSDSDYAGQKAQMENQYLRVVAETESETK